MFKAVGRFLLVLSIGILLGAGLFLAMRYVAQPVMGVLDPESEQEAAETFEAEPFRLPDLEDVVRGSLSVAKDAVGFAVATVIVVGVQTLIPKKGRKRNQEERYD